MNSVMAMMMHNFFIDAKIRKSFVIIVEEIIKFSRAGK